MFRFISVICFLLFTDTVYSQETPIQAGDLLRVSIYDNPDLTTEAEVSNNGYINIPLVGEVQISSLNSNEAASKIEDILIEKKVLKNPQIIIVILDSKSSTVSVLGNVYAPGKYKINAGAKNVIDFIALSGGLKPNASEELIIIKPRLVGSDKRIKVNLYEIFQSGNLDTLNTESFNVKAGDIIYVPEVSIFYIYGQVNRPGSFPIKKGMTVAQALATAGGINSKGTLRGLSLERLTEEGTYIEIQPEKATVIQDKDTIYVKESIF